MTVTRPTSTQTKQNAGSRPHLVQQVRQCLGHTVVPHVEADKSQVSAVCVQVVQTLLVEGGARRRALRPFGGAAVAQGVLQLPQGRQDVVTSRLTHTHRETSRHSQRTETTRMGIIWLIIIIIHNKKNYFPIK